MLSHTDLKKGVRIILDKEPYEVLEARPMKKAQRRPVIQSRVKNLITGSVFEQNFQQGDVFEEAELLKLKAKFLYIRRDRYFFCEENNPSKRFDLNSEQLGVQTKFLKANQIVEALIFNEKVINISIPIKTQLKVTEAPPGIKGDRAQGGTKIATLETGVQVAVPLFVATGDTIEINTETGEYVRRVEEH
ncbi:elongation factor P [Candidatus Wolfebacteria bacterium CG03_land_8_20_14_0_80_40_12]|uniref:Elongation factor P n=1 Tax=Candidatus Wolfebacteria bacterium CG03_land_8_20_14_0_80_40_12 TaxID=1975069 RepID=A0A2M7B4X5_9BACT|nr:MAG: elongation factor P [Candidatus Wolfebacteria bacterium CG03_land_8_20_14_0_80_40_12]